MDWRSRIPTQVRQLATRALRVFDPHAALSYSQEGEDMILRRIFAGKADGFYVDVGAHHPFRYSNTCLLSEMGWRGINIDADPTLIAAFHRHRPRDTNLSMGVSDALGTLTFHVFNEPALNTFDPAVAADKARLPGYRIVSRQQIKVDRLDAILAAHLPKGREIDLLSVDAEGFDLKVLRSNDWATYRPRVALVELFSRPLPEVLASETHAFMTAQGYQLYAKAVNTLVYVDEKRPVA